MSFSIVNTKEFDNELSDLVDPRVFTDLGSLESVYPAAEYNQKLALYTSNDELILYESDGVSWILKENSFDYIHINLINSSDGLSGITPLTTVETQDSLVDLETNFPAVVNSNRFAIVLDESEKKLAKSIDDQWLVELTDPSVPVDDLFAAYSLRKVVNDYSGACIRVRRLSDNAEQDIGFSGEDLDIAELESFVNGGDGVIRTWYDQGPNGHDLVATSNVYRIVTAGSVTSDAEGRPFCQQVGNTSGAGVLQADIRDTPGVDKSFPRCQWYHVVQRLSAATFVAPLQLIAISTTGATNIVGGGITNRVSVFTGSTRTDSANNVWMTNDGTWRTLNGHAGTGTDGRRAWLDGSLVVSAGGGGANYNTLRLGDGAGDRFIFREHILYTPDGAYQDSAIREAIEADQRAYWID